MRTTMTIDDEIYRIAKSIAQERNISLGRALSEMARKGIGARPAYDTTDGLPVFSVSEHAKPLTTDDVRRAEDEDA